MLENGAFVAGVGGSSSVTASGPHLQRDGFRAWCKRIFRKPKLDQFKAPPDGKSVQADPSSAASANLIWADAAKVMGDVWKNEETRFNNLNSRAIALLSALSLILTVLGFVSKSIFDRSASALLDPWELVAKIGMLAALVLFFATAVLLIFNVLLPSGRLAFGANALVNDTVLTSAVINETAYREYGAMAAVLAGRTALKAYWLTLSYLTFILALFASAAVVFAIVIGYSNAQDDIPKPTPTTSVSPTPSG